MLEGTSVEVTGEGGKHPKSSQSQPKSSQSTMILYTHLLTFIFLPLFICKIFRDGVRPSVKNKRAVPAEILGH